VKTNENSVRSAPTRRTIAESAQHPRACCVASFSFFAMHLRRFLPVLWRDWIRPLALPLLLIAGAKSALADINYVPTGSMKPTILEGDVVFINKLAYDLRVPFTTARIAQWANPTHGDIVVCFSPEDGMRLVKRVIGLPGDTVELRNEVLFLNGVAQRYAPLPDAVTEDLNATDRAALFAREQLSNGRGHAVMVEPHRPSYRNFGPVTVPADSYFVLGDNRDNSKDSRMIGVIPRREIFGEAVGVFVSADRERWLRPRFGRFFSALE
jgi:signal peptidase I